MKKTFIKIMIILLVVAFPFLTFFSVEYFFNVRRIENRLKNNKIVNDDLLSTFDEVNCNVGFLRDNGFNGKDYLLFVYGGITYNITVLDSNDDASSYFKPYQLTSEDILWKKDVSTEKQVLKYKYSVNFDIGHLQMYRILAVQIDNNIITCSTSYFSMYKYFNSFIEKAEN